MHKERLADWAKGKVWGYFINPITKETTKPFAIHNILTYAAADTMARLVGGDTSYLPKYVGFVYGTKASPGIVDPITSRVQNWTDLGNELAPVAKANVLITPFASTPGYAVDAALSLPAGTYAGNEVTISAHTGSRLEYGFAAGATYASPIADGSYVYHCMLITRIVSGSTITYLPFARVSLKDGSYPQKPVGMELAIFWAITFS